MTAPLTAKSGRVKAARKLTRADPGRAAALPRRGRQGADRGAASAGGVVEVFATEAASEQYAALRKAVDDAGRPVAARRRRRGRLAERCGHPAGHRRGLPLPRRRLDDVLDAVVSERQRASRHRAHPRDLRRRPRPRQRRHGDPHRRRVGRRRASSSPATASTPTTTRPSGRPSAASGTCRSRWHDDPADVVRRAQAAGFVVLAADGAGETDLFEAEALRTARRQGRVAVRQRGLGPARRARGAGRPPGLDPDLRPRREPQPLHRRSGLPLRQRAPADLSDQQLLVEELGEPVLLRLRLAVALVLAARA